MVLVNKKHFQEQIYYTYGFIKKTVINILF